LKYLLHKTEDAFHSVIYIPKNIVGLAPTGL
jgi:hypothetical protein